LIPEDVKRRRKRLRTVGLLVVLAIFAAYIVYGSMSSVQAECELCVTYRGRTECRRGSGVDEEDARKAAVKAACAVMAAGMNESIACANTPPTNVGCPPR
jgi:hypothetical protein